MVFVLVFDIIYLLVIVDMEGTWFNVIFNKDFDDNYENVMNRVVDHINYCDGDGSGGSKGVGDVGENDNDNEDDDNDRNGESFQRRQFDRKKLLVCTTEALNMYYINYMHK